MFRRLFPAALATTSLILVGCGGGQDDAAADTVVTEQPTSLAPPDVAASDDDDAPVDEVFLAIGDTLGTFDGEVTGIAVWQHETSAFRSAVIAANGEAGLFSIPVDPDLVGEATSIPGNFNGGVALTYTDFGAMLAAYEGSTQSIAFFIVDPANGQLFPLNQVNVDRPATDLCFVGADLVQVDDQNTTHFHRLIVEGTRVGLESEVLPITGSMRCSGTLTGGVMAKQAGLVTQLRLAANGEIRPRALDPVPGVAGVALMPTAVEPEVIYLINDGTLAFSDRTLIVQDLNTSSTVELTYVTAGGGNFGGVYRDGIVAALTADNSLVIIPWSGVTAAAEFGRPSIGPYASDDDAPAEQGITIDLGPLTDPTN